MGKIVIISTFKTVQNVSVCVHVQESKQKNKEEKIVDGRDAEGVKMLQNTKKLMTQKFFPDKNKRFEKRRIDRWREKKRRIDRDRYREREREEENNDEIMDIKVLKY